MTTSRLPNLKLLSTVAILTVAIATPSFAQEFGAIGPGSRNGLEPEPGPVYGQGYAPEYLQGPQYGYDRGYAPSTGFAPFDAAAGIVTGAVDTAAAIATAPFRAFDNSGSYAMMQGDASYCAQRSRSYDPQSQTYLGYDGQRHPCG